jgi:hypothetical protein
MDEFLQHLKEIGKLPDSVNTKVQIYYSTTNTILLILVSILLITKYIYTNVDLYINVICMNIGIL